MVPAHLSRAAIPLHMGDRVLGVMAVLSTEHEDPGGRAGVLELLAGQVTIAMENARTYERERLAIQRLEDAEVFKGRFWRICRTNYANL